MKKFGITIFAFLISFSPVSLSQVQLTGSAYTQDFNTLSDSSSSSVLPDDWYLYESGTGADNTYAVGSGSSTAGNTYSFGLEGNTERALGSIGTGSLTPSYGANFINNTGDVITLLHITYTGEQWRVANRSIPDRLDFQYSLNATSLSDGDWIPVDQLDFLSPNISNSASALDGNLSANRIEITHTITGLSISDGSEFWIKWTDFDVSGSDDGLAIDDFHIDLTAPAVTFTMNPASLNFDSVGIGSSSTFPITVENQGTTDDLSITNIVSSNPVFAFSPAVPVTISPGSSRVFNITFTPSGEGTETGTIEFTHNAPGSPSALSLSGIGEAQSQGGFLKFISSVSNLLDGTKADPDTIVLSGYSGQPLKALQFNLIVGNSNGGLILRSVSRGSAIPAGQFNFSYEIYRGSFLPNGSSIDTVKVVILGNSTNAINPDPGNQEIMIFSYDIVPISGISVQTYNALSEVTGATSSPVNDAGIAAGSDETINIFNGTLEGLLGDVNLDDQVNILDILLMVDYILGKEELSAVQFFNGDLSPWESGNSLPTRDGIIDVLDLAVLQNIVLTGTYPSNTPVYKMAKNSFESAGNKMNKITPGMKAKVMFYFTNEGITIGLESLKKVKGLQIELNQLGLSIPQNTIMTSIFNQAFFYQNNSFLRMLLYDDQSVMLNAGEYLIANIPFSLINPEDIVIENVIVADEDNSSMQKVEIEIHYDNPNIPLDYMLSQNYPNPFNPNTLLKFSVPKEEFVTIKIYNIIGQEITTLFAGNAKPGIYTLKWDGTDCNGKQVSSGSYIYRMTAGEFVQTKKMMYLK